MTISSLSKSKSFPFYHVFNEYSQMLIKCKHAREISAVTDHSCWLSSEPYEGFNKNTQTETPQNKYSHTIAQSQNIHQPQAG